MKKVLIILSVFISFIAISQTNEEIQMFNEVNNFRQNPQSYIPLVEHYLKMTKIEHQMYKDGRLKKEVKSIKHDGKKTTISNFDVDEMFKIKYKACNELLSILDTLKPLNEFKFDTTLYKVTKEHAKYLLELDDLTASGHLGPNYEDFSVRFVNIGYYNVTENVARGGDVNKHILELLIDYSNNQRGHRYEILNPNTVYVSVAVENDVSVMNFVCELPTRT